MKKHNIAILGGTGFVGRHIVNQLAKQGHTVQVLCRRREDRRELLVLPTVNVIEADIHSLEELKQHFAGCDTVINLVGILNETGKNRTFQKAHVDLAKKVVEACQANGISRLLHMSALNAAEDAPSKYLQSKGQAEKLVLSAEGIDVTCFRPSVIFGREDSFFNKFACLIAWSPMIMPLPGADARFAPIYVEDVAQAFVQAIDIKATFGQSYNLCGPKQYTLKELVNYVKVQTGSCRIIVNLGAGTTSIMASIMQFMPGKPLTPDNVRSMSVDSVCKEGFPEVFDIQPRSVEAMVPRYLGQAEKNARYNQFRRGAGRDE